LNAHHSQTDDLFDLSLTWLLTFSAPSCRHRTASAREAEVQSTASTCDCSFSEVPTTLSDQFEVRCCYNPQQPALNSTQLKLRGFQNSAPTNTNPNNQHCATLEQQFMVFNSSTTLHGRFVHFIKHSRDPFAFVRKIQLQGSWAFVYINRKQGENVRAKISLTPHQKLFLQGN
jgi:hypothetical protein